MVLAEDGTSGDAAAIPAALMVLHRDPDRHSLVVEIRDRRTGRDLTAATAGRVHIVEADDVIAKVTAQACYQAGQGTVYQELLNFSGDEIYLASAAPVMGHTFGEALLGYETSTLIGMVSAEDVVRLAPPMDTPFVAGDRVVAISADDDTVVFTGFRPGDHPGEMPAPAPLPAESFLLVASWSSLGGRVLRELQAFDHRPTLVDVLVDETLVQADDSFLGDPGLGIRTTSSPDERADLIRLMADRRTITCSSSATAAG